MQSYYAPAKEKSAWCVRPPLKRKIKQYKTKCILFTSADWTSSSLFSSMIALAELWNSNSDTSGDGRGNCVVSFFSSTAFCFISCRTSLKERIFAMLVEWANYWESDRNYHVFNQSPHMRRSRSMHRQRQSFVLQPKWLRKPFKKMNRQKTSQEGSMLTNYLFPSSS